MVDFAKRSAVEAARATDDEEETVADLAPKSDADELEPVTRDEDGNCECPECGCSFPVMDAANNTEGSSGSDDDTLTSDPNEPAEEDHAGDGFGFSGGRS